MEGAFPRFSLGLRFWRLFAVSRNSVPHPQLEGFVVSRMYSRLKLFVRWPRSPSFRPFLGNVEREVMQRGSVILHDTLGSYIREVVHGPCLCTLFP
jgi:hypothetical protein